MACLKQDNLLNVLAADAGSIECQDSALLFL